jgi:AcrR family transcriptional regulator
VIERLAAVFRSSGFERASLSDLSRASGLQRSSLYHLFPDGKAQMAREVIDRSNEVFSEYVLATLEGDAPPRVRFDRMVRSINRYYDKGREACLLGIFALELPSDAFGASIRAGFERWIELLTKLFADDGYPRKEAVLRAREVVAAVQGSLVVSRGMGSTVVFRDLMARLGSGAFGVAPSKGRVIEQGPIEEGRT